jgi:carboxypeptidase C (cathepsin A)
MSASRMPTTTNTSTAPKGMPIPFLCGPDYSDVDSPCRASKDVQQFLSIFFETFDLKGRPFHIAGEVRPASGAHRFALKLSWQSYGGRYIPLFAGTIVDENRKAVAGGHTPINLKSVLIGNGLTDEITAIPTYYNQGVFYVLH